MQSRKKKMLQYDEVTSIRAKVTIYPKLGFINFVGSELFKYVVEAMTTENWSLAVKHLRIYY